MYDQMMSSATLPPGFRFHPTDEELVGYYLKRKVDGQKIELEVIPVIDLYKFDPWELPDKSFLPKRDMEWFFFCPRDRKYPNGSRTNRATESGYWKATGKDRRVTCERSVTALRKTLVFYRGRAPAGQRTDWVMHEYRLCDDASPGSCNFVGAFALCRVVKRHEYGLKTGEAQEEPRAKRALSSAFNDLCSRKESNNVLRNSSPKANYMSTGSCASATTTSSLVDMPMHNDQVNIRDSNSQFNIPQSFLLQEGIFSDMAFQESANAAEMRPPCNISPVSSYASLTEDSSITDDMNDNGYLEPFSSPMHFMGMYNIEEQMNEQTIGWNQATYMNQPLSAHETWMSTPPICRQASEDEFSLWLQEESLIYVK